MKKMLLSALVIATLAIAPAVADVIINSEQLPQPAQAFLQKNFASNKVLTALHDNDISDNDYTVVLNNGVKVEFDRNGEWESIKVKGVALPSGIIPEAIQHYVAQRFGNVAIEKVERKRYGYEVELANDLELKFDANGKFLRMDD